ncbi:MAG: ABC transporter substrate-binding protein [Pseudomonadota bacterium]|nr:ABC transporter substrate-binding protein [Pseudomonadota bacterium]
MKMAILWRLAALLLLLPAAGVPAAPAPDELIQSAAERLFDALQAQRQRLKSEPQRGYAIVEEIILPHIDFRRIPRWVLGRYWRTASPEQRRRFAREFETFVIRTYTHAMVEFTDTILAYKDFVRFLPARVRPEEDEATVRSEIRHPEGGPPVPVSYHLHRDDETWRIYDISIDGISLVATYRSTFAARIRRDGLDALTDDLAARNRRPPQSLIQKDGSIGVGGL